METANHEYYVSLEVAKLLKQAGFDWETFSHWAESDINSPDFKFSGLSDKPILYDGYIPISEDACVGRKKDWNNYNNECPLIHNYSAPTLDIAQRWLREVKDVEIYIRPFRHPEYDRTFYHVSICDVYGNIDEYPNSTMGSYEEEQEAGIKKALEIILEKGK